MGFSAVTSVIHLPEQVEPTTRSAEKLETIHGMVRFSVGLDHQETLRKRINGPSQQHISVNLTHDRHFQ